MKVLLNFIWQILMNFIFILKGIHDHALDENKSPQIRGGEQRMDIAK